MFTKKYNMEKKTLLFFLLTQKKESAIFSLTVLNGSYGKKVCSMKGKEVHTKEKKVTAYAFFALLISVMILVICLKDEKKNNADCHVQK